jgi:hypothetical protein
VDHRFYDSLLLSPPRILGEGLRPFSIGHHAILTTIGSPYIHGGSITLPDTLLAIGICQRNFVAARDFLLNPRARARAARKFWKRMCRRKVSHEIIARLLADYIGAYCAVPEVWKKNGTGTDKLPLHLALIEATGIPVNQAWDFPFGEAYWHMLAHTGNGDKIIDQKQKDIIAHLKAAYEALQSRPAGAPDPHPSPSSFSSPATAPDAPAANLEQIKGKSNANSCEPTKFGEGKS